MAKADKNGSKAERPRRALYLPVLFSLGFGTLLLLIGASLYLFLSTGNSFRWVNHTHLVIIKAEEVLQALTEAEANQRGYLVTADPSFVTRHVTVRATIASHVRELEQLVGDNARQAQLIEALQPLLDLKLAELQAGIDWRHNMGSLPEADDFARQITAEGRVASEQIRMAINQFIRNESDFLLQREREFSRRSQITGIAIGLALITTTVLTGLASRYLYLRMRELEAMVTICAWTKRVRRGGKWITIEEFLRDRYNLRLSHGISEEAARQLQLEELDSGSRK